MNKNFNNPVVDSVKTLIDIEDYNIFKGTLRDPGLFYPGNLYSKYTYEKEGIEKEIVANEYIPGYKLEFKRLGDTHVISKVLDPSDNEILSNLDTLIYTGPKYGLDYPLYSNLFWPLDEHAAQEGSCSDMLKPLGKALTDASGGSLDFDPNDEDKVIGETTRHNWLFGMNFSLKFNTKEYIGPLNYYFRGDDDLFVYVDGHLMVDIGGIHSSYGSFVDVKQWLVKEHLAELNEATGELIPLVDGEKDPDHEYTMSVFYTERGGTGSCCYMQYTLPKVKPIEVPIPDTITHTVNKRWNDGNNIGNARPENLAMQIYRNNEPYGELMYIGNSESVDDNQTWRHTWNNLPAFDENGEKYVYEVREINVDTNEYIQTENKHDTNNTNLINTSKSDSISVSKAWSDSTPMNQRTPIKVGLYKYSYKIDISDSEAYAGEGEESGDPELGEGSEESGESTDEPSGFTDETDEPSSGNSDDSQETESVVENELTRSDLTPEMIDKLELVSFEGLNYCQDVEPIIELSSTNSSYSWDNLPAYENDGRKILYVPFEVEVDDKGIVNRIDEGHTTSDEKFVVNYDGNNHITNNYNLMALAANKTWAVQNELDKDIENTIRPEIGVQLYQNGYTYGKSVILNEANNWTCEFTDVPRVSEDGTEYNYTVKETYQGSTVTDDTITVDNKYQYQVTYTESGNLLTVNNTLKEVKRANFTVKKEWKGEEGAINKETSIDIGLFRDGELYEKVTLNEENGWQHSWNNMELNKDLDTQYSYSIYELNGDTKLEDDTDVRFNGVDKYKVQYKTENGLTVITNTFQEIPKINLLVQKGWNDGEQKRHNDMSYGPELNCRPTFIKIQLYQDGAAFGEPVRMTGDRYIEDEPWTYRFKDLPKYHVVNGEEVDYVYTVKELNTNGEPMDNKDTCRFNGVDKYEVGYESEVDTEKGKYTITNKYLKPIMKDISIEKKWDKDDESKRPSEIIVNLYQDNNLLETISLNKDNDWKVTRNVMVERNDASLYEYHVKEVFKGKELESGDRVKFNGVDKYEVAYTSNDVTSDNFVITNSFIEPNRRDINVQKVWEDNTASTRPDSIKVRLYKDDEIFDTVDLNSENGWKYEWEGLLVNRNDENETEFDYSIKEVFVKDGKEIELEDGDIVRLNGIDKYETNYSKRDADHFVITNKFVEPTMKDVSVEKVWIDNGSSTRPDGIEVGLYQDNRLINRVTLNESNNWKHTWSVQVERNDDSLYEYDISELFNDEAVVEGTWIRFNGVDKYLVSYEDNEENRDEHKIINRFIEPDMTSVRVEKVWSEQSSNNRPSSIKVHLYQDSNIFDTVELNNENGWTTTWVVPVNRLDDSVYEYTIKEVFEDRDLVEGEVVKFGRGEYKVSYTVIGENNFRITNTQQNTYTPPSGGGGGGGERITPPDTVPDKARNPVNDIHVNKPLIALYNIMDNMVPMTQKTEEISDNETPLFGLPGTGDKTNLGKYMLLCFISALGLLGLAFKNKKEEED